MRDSRAIDIVPRAPTPEEASKEKILLVNAMDRDEARIALLVDGRLEEVYVELADAERSSAGNVYRGRVQNVERGIGAAFVDLGRGLTGFLHATDLPLTDDETVKQDVTERLRPGDEVIVQITRDGIGRKGPALTGRISFPGRYLVLMPLTARSGISRRIPQGPDRERVRRLLRELEVPEGMGVIVRTASETTDLAALQGDLDHLLREWLIIKRKAAEPGQPGLLRGESDLAERSVRDIMPGDVTRIIVDKDDLAGRIHRLLRVWYPSAADASDKVSAVRMRAMSASIDAPLGELAPPVAPEPVAREADGDEGPEPAGDAEPAEPAAPVETPQERLARLEAVAQQMPELEIHTEAYPLFHKYGAESQLEDAYRRSARLPSGGSIVIDQTEALVAVDVNSGRLTDEADPESTALVTNLEAVEEAARQLRLRDLGGLVVIDFIDMRERTSRRQVEKALREALARDRARIRLGTMDPFGLVVLSRQRIRQALTRVTHELCEHCAGTGRRRQISGLGLRIVREMEARIARSRGRGGLEVRAPAEVVAWIQRQRPGAIKQFRKACSGPVSLEADSRLAADGWAMKGLPPTGGAGEEGGDEEE
ncbi:MAG: ribonuclease E/G [Planctomycetota bacterium]|nr:ribonuclease E/G [Planctomycetota bacterium]